MSVNSPRRLSSALGSPLAACLLLFQLGGCQALAPSGGDEVRPATADLPIKEARIGGGPAAKEARPAEAASQDMQGACTKEDRSEYVHDSNAKFVGDLRDCSKETWADKEKNMGCLKEAMPSLSHSCANCFANMASCAKDNCKAPCMFDAKSERCLNCANTNCQASLVKCTGVARADLP